MLDLKQTPSIFGRAALLHHNVRAALILMVGICVGSTMAICFRYLGEDYSPFQIVAVRASVMLCVLLPLLMRVGLSMLRTSSPLQLLARAVLGVGGQVFAVLAILNMPLAEVQALGFTKGFIIALLGFLLLSERISALRWAAIGLGFLGVLIILRPEGGFNWSALYAIGSAFCFSFSTIITKNLLKTHTAQALMTYGALLQFMIVLIPTIFLWRTPEVQDIPWFVGIGVIALCVQPLNLMAFRIGDVNALAPVDFFRLVPGTLIGYFLFEETPSPQFWLGTLVIVVSNIISFRANDPKEERAEIISDK